jgi:hypothetical protein
MRRKEEHVDAKRLVADLNKGHFLIVQLAVDSLLLVENGGIVLDVRIDEFDALFGYAESGHQRVLARQLLKVEPGLRRDRGRDPGGDLRRILGRLSRRLLRCWSRGRRFVLVRDTIDRLDQTSRRLGHGCRRASESQGQRGCGGANMAEPKQTIHIQCSPSSIFRRDSMAFAVDWPPLGKSHSASLYNGF